MAHPKREQYFNYLKRKLGDVPFSIDKGWGITENCVRAWKLHNPKAEFHVVIQDDAIVCRNFRERAEALLDDDTVAYQFFYGNRIKFDKDRDLWEKQGYVMQDKPRWGVAICLPVRHIDPMLKFFQTLNLPQDDERISRYMQSVGLKIKFPIPSLINHRDSIESLVGNNMRDRRAYYFIDGPKPNL